MYDEVNLTFGGVPMITDHDDSLAMLAQYFRWNAEVGLFKAQVSTSITSGKAHMVVEMGDNLLIKNECVDIEIESPEESIQSLITRCENKISETFGGQWMK